MNTPITLTPENSARIAKYSRLISWTEADLANCLLTEILELFADSSSGALEGFLGRIYKLEIELNQVLAHIPRFQSP